MLSAVIRVSVVTVEAAILLKKISVACRLDKIDLRDDDAKRVCPVRRSGALAFRLGGATKIRS